MEQNKDPKLDKSWRNAMVMVGIAFSIPSAFASPIFIGYLLDKECNSSPTFLLIGLFLGGFSVVIALKTLIKKMNTMK
ncbi:MAG: AtpZ/AtpI family protein [Acidobacteria bacterium]|nr:AtpZ/AtpI family protein [Acidobacteriota bacterium]